MRSFWPIFRLSGLLPTLRLPATKLTWQNGLD
jgi:hypothetical protein